MDETGVPPDLSTCARCARHPRDADDRDTWVTIDEARICLGCLTLAEAETLRSEGGSS